MGRVLQAHQEDMLPPPYPLESTIPEGFRKKRERSYAAKFGPEFNVRSFAEYEDPCAALVHFNTILLIDDSARTEPYWDEVEKILEIIAPVCTEYDPNGIDIQLIHHRPSLLSRRRGYSNVRFASRDSDEMDNVAGIFRALTPKGKCKMGKRLRNILDDYVEQYCEQLAETGRRIMPLNLIIITSGVADDDPYNTLVRTARQLDECSAPPWQVGIQFFQVGREPDATWDLQSIDSNMWKREEVRDIVDTVTWTGDPGELSPGGLLKTILGAVKRSIDKMPV